MLSEEVAAIQNYLDTGDMACLAVQAAVETPTPEYQKYIIAVMTGKSKQSHKRSLAIIGELLYLYHSPLDLSHSPYDEPGSVFDKLALISHLKPSTIQSAYYNYRREVAPVVKLCQLYKENPDEVPEQYLQLVQSQILLAETISTLFENER